MAFSPSASCSLRSSSGSLALRAPRGGGRAVLSLLPASACGGVPSAGVSAFRGGTSSSLTFRPLSQSTVDSLLLSPSFLRKTCKCRLSSLRPSPRCSLLPTHTLKGPPLKLLARRVCECLWGSPWSSSFGLLCLLLLLQSVLHTSPSLRRPGHFLASSVASTTQFAPSASPPLSTLSPRPFFSAVSFLLPPLCLGVSRLSSPLFFASSAGPALSLLATLAPAAAAGVSLSPVSGSPSTLRRPRSDLSSLASPSAAPSCPEAVPFSSSRPPHAAAVASSLPRLSAGLSSRVGESSGASWRRWRAPVASAGARHLLGGLRCLTFAAPLAFQQPPQPGRRLWDSAGHTWESLSASREGPIRSQGQGAEAWQRALIPRHLPPLLFLQTTWPQLASLATSRVVSAPSVFLSSSSPCEDLRRAPASLFSSCRQRASPRVSPPPSAGEIAGACGEDPRGRSAAPLFASFFSAFFSSVKEKAAQRAAEGDEAREAAKPGAAEREAGRANSAAESERGARAIDAEDSWSFTQAQRKGERPEGSPGASANGEASREPPAQTAAERKGEESEESPQHPAGDERKTRRRPWNYGRPWSDEIRKKIAERTRDAMQRLKAEKDAQKKPGEESQAPSSASSGVRASLSPTARQKLSERLRARWRDPEARLKLLQLGRQRRQSAATRAAIAQSVRRRWREDSAYAERVRQAQAKVNASGEKRKKISDTLKRLWKDEAFRQRMKTTRRPYTEERRRALSAKITAMWADHGEYRSRTIDAIRSRFDRLREEEGLASSRKARGSRSPTQGAFSRLASRHASSGSRAPDLLSLLGVKQPPHSQRQEFWQRMYQKLLSEETEGERDAAVDEENGARRGSEMREAHLLEMSC
ncbi:hypothetical protein BESB_049390 [Besnoitia besnoiti]|uniref:Uncharacterized protein n=1 Tax=Besnoitia besnoiti TaxID=94643 RepID=A0A2A9MLZ9_BESBE|nr:hypothetical protein BESB_049390 [Besnoitia besnoiti]PFH36747.1 hypothetical protein BESB_049390 [Besnoitia besnoiti]